MSDYDPRKRCNRRILLECHMALGTVYDREFAGFNVNSLYSF
ncbi:hypothetical protein SAMN04487950_4135 [Halogranum rubrum]|uniref:Uncharacterized protein n=1 Tax=Halogranum rubrum TaxID=553466 RepID=A0A1I4II24_9EURY|nr:hypothetical protein SAMN04487950_4135 [Halogranum rubrum]